MKSKTAKNTTWKAQNPTCCPGHPLLLAVSGNGGWAAIRQTRDAPCKPSRVRYREYRA